MLALALLAAGCGGTSAYSVAKTKNCLQQRGAQVTPPQHDFVATTATGGAFEARLGDNRVWMVFGQNQHDAEQIVLAYQKFALPNVKPGLADVVRRVRNAVMRWQEHPQDADLALVVG